MRSSMKSPQIALLIGFNLIWSLNPIVTKWLLEDLPFPVVAWLRYFSAFLSYALLWLVLVARGKVRWPRRVFSGLRNSDLRQRPPARLVAGIFAIALTTFFLGPLAQMKGLTWSKAADLSLLTALEPMMAVGLAWLFLGEALDRRQKLTTSLAFVGFLFLSDVKWSSLAIFDPHLVVNLCLLAMVSCDAGYSVISKGLLNNRHLKNLPGHFIFGSAIALGSVFLTICLFSFYAEETRAAWPFLWSKKVLLATLYLGPLATCAGYLLWVFLLGVTPIATMALSLYVQPVAGLVFAAVFLQESFKLMELVGAVIILLALCVQFWRRRS